MPCSIERSRCSFSISALSPKPLSMIAQPSAARARATPRPMPLVEPVTTATLLLRLMRLSLEEAFSAAALLALGRDLVSDAHDLTFELGDVGFEFGDGERSEVAQLRCLA